MTDEDEDYVDENDFLIRIRPIKTSDDEFNGEAHFSVMTSRDSQLSPQLSEDFEYIVKCMLATIPLMEQDEAFRDFVVNYVDNYFHYEFNTDSVPVIESVDGNVIKINFDTKTKGNA